MTLTVALPAHNEAHRIQACLQSIAAQTVPPDRVVVIDDNSTDRTAEVAVEHGAEVFTTVGNSRAKAGALNQFLTAALAAQPDSDYIVVVDADGVLDRDFIENALAWWRRGFAAVGGVFRAESTGTFVGWCQANEYERYRYLLRRSRGRTLVLTGTATLFTVGLLREIVAARADGRIPSSLAQPESVYSYQTLTEDLELTLAIKSLGHYVTAPIECSLTTEAMTSWSALARQRFRWKYGALATAWLYPNRHGWTFHRLQVWNLAGIFATLVYLWTLVWALATNEFRLFPIWVAVTAIYCVERAVTVAGRGWRAMVGAFFIIPEMVFDVVLQIVQLRAITAWLLGRSRGWYG